MSKLASALFLSVFSWQTLFASEGMWIPIFLNKYNIEDMQKMGFKLSAEDIYSINNSSIKDAVVIFGGGCTGELISDEGLLITNHHCGYDQIQSHSSVEHDYLTNGFWAKSRKEELPNDGLSVKFVERIDDVTAKVLLGTENMSDSMAQASIEDRSKAIAKEASKDGKYYTLVKPLFYGNQYFLFVYKEYKDVRLVGAPPSALGKFGGDTDNWMWPRHTCDFSLFRIYANANNEPAEYSQENKAYKARYSLPISLKGVKENDFTMILGFPGSTQEYLPSQAVSILKDQSYPDKVAIRDVKLNILRKYMEQSPAVRIKYAAKYARVSNAWKKWQGEIVGLNELNALGYKQQFEKDFQAWAEKKHQDYADVLRNIAEIYSDASKVYKTYDYYREGIYGSTDVARLISTVSKELSTDWNVEELGKMTKSVFKDYFKDADKETFVALMGKCIADLGAGALPEGFVSKYTSDYLTEIYNKSLFIDVGKTGKLLAMSAEEAKKEFANDALAQMFAGLDDKYRGDVKPAYDIFMAKATAAQKQYMKGIMEYRKNEKIYPDANFTMRVSYGRINGSYPRDGLYYLPQTSVEGVLAKDNPDIYDYRVPEKLKELVRNKDYGKYDENGKLYTCFLASNHTTGGNSGSPVLNANGELVGVNFDRTWESTMSDIFYDAQRCRNIALDIRYALFIIDKFAGASYLIDEMTLKQ
ncbi:MAG: S46 family peptidase [Bacteroidales bacterium]